MCVRCVWWNHFNVVAVNNFPYDDAFHRSIESGLADENYWKILNALSSLKHSLHGMCASVCVYMHTAQHSFNERQQFYKTVKIWASKQKAEKQKQRIVAHVPPATRTNIAFCHSVVDFFSPFIFTFFSHLFYGFIFKQFKLAIVVAIAFIHSHNTNTSTILAALPWHHIVRSIFS